MLTWVVAAAPRSGLDTPEVAERVRRAALAVPAGANTPYEWTSRGGRVRLWAWDRQLPIVPSGPCVDIRPTGVLALAGVPIEPGRPWPTGRWLADLHDRIGAATVADVAEGLRGPCSLVHLRHDGPGAIAPDPLSGGLVFIGRRDDMTVLSNRPSCIEPFVTANPEGSLERDAEGLAWIVLAGEISGERTGLRGVDLARAGDRFVVHSTGSVDTVARPRPYLDPQPSDDLDDLVRDAADELTCIADTLSRVAAPLSFGLTGGRDSRVALAALVACGRAGSLHYRTMGPPDAADSVVACELASHLHLDHSLVGTAPPARTHEWLWERLTIGQFLGSGLVPAKELGWAGEDASHVFVEGSYGEQLRAKGAPPAIASTADLDALLARRLTTSQRGGICRRTVEQRHVDTLIELAHRASHVAPGDALHRLFVDHSCRRWVGTVATLNVGAPRIYPLYTVAGLRAAMSLGHDGRRAEVLPYRLTRRLAPHLADLRFAGKAWPELADGGRPVPAPPVVAVAGPPPTRKGTSVEAHREVFSELLLNGGGVEEIIDVDRVASILDGREPLTPLAERQLYNAAGVSIWLRREERAPSASAAAEATARTTSTPAATSAGELTSPGASRTQRLR